MFDLHHNSISYPYHISDTVRHRTYAESTRECMHLCAHRDTPIVYNNYNNDDDDVITYDGGPPGPACGCAGADLPRQSV